MKTEEDNKGKMRRGARIVAFSLVAGGLRGIPGSVMTAIHRTRVHQDAMVIPTVLSVALFAWSIWTGIALWRGVPRGFRWAQILLALQVPTFSVARFSSEFSTLLSFRVMTAHHTGGNVGSSSNIYLSPQSPGFLFGTSDREIAPHRPL